MRALARVGLIFPRSTVVDTVQTAMKLDAPPQAVWSAMLFYEEVPRRPMPLLRAFLPVPVRTEGEKTRVGAVIQCTYDGGDLEKRITTVDPGRFVGFRVLVQRLGIEACVSMEDGSYELRPAADGSTAIALTTRYRGHLRPRWLWRPLERWLGHQVHRHILLGMREALRTSYACTQELPKTATG